jgi:ribosomal protein L11 methyltransferase
MPFWQLTVPASPDTSDGLTNFLWEQGALGVVEEEVDSEPARLVAFFSETVSSTGLLNAVNAYRDSLSALGFALGPEEPRITPLLDGAWATAWRQSFPPRVIGKRLIVLPPWEEGATPHIDECSSDSVEPPLRPLRVAVVIEPGRAFGTGHHASTEGCLVLLESALAGTEAPRVLDVGTGSGILAVAAAKLGARRVLGIDIDPDAVAAARANAARNDCAERIEIALASLEALAVDPFPIVVANLLAPTHRAWAPVYPRFVTSGGTLILGGILEGETAPVATALGGVGFALRERLTLDGWCSLWLIRGDHDPGRSSS